MSKRKNEQRGTSALVEGLQNYSVPARPRKSRWLVGGVGVIMLLTIGVFAKNGWFPSTDSMSGTKTGWFGKQLPNNASSRWNPTPTSPTPLPLSKEYIYAGSKLIAVDDAKATPALPADLAIWRKTTGAWWVLSGAADGNYGNYYGDSWGIDGDDPVEGDYDGDGKTDFAVFRPSNVSWYIINSSTGSGLQFPFGLAGDVPVQADYDGDGRTDPALFRPSTFTWYLGQSTNGVIQYSLGTAGDKLAPADYDGDGRADPGVYRGGTATDPDPKFHYLSSANNFLEKTITFGQDGDFPVPADYDGDGRADAAVWRPGVYQWHILNSSNQTWEAFTFGDPNSDINVSNDYDADGKVDRAFWRPSEGKWYIAQSSKKGQPDELRTVVWGMNGDIPVPAFYNR